MSNNKQSMKIDEEIVRELMSKTWDRGFLIGFIAASIISSIIVILIMTTTQ
jgi:hypothetical protein